MSEATEPGEATEPAGPNEPAAPAEQEALQLEIQRLELETQRLELEIKREELQNQRMRGRRLALSPVWIPVVAATFALFGSLSTAAVQARDRKLQGELDRQKFENSVVQEALKEVEPRRAAARILIAARGGYVHLNHEQAERLGAIVRGDADLPDYIRVLYEPYQARPRPERTLGARETLAPGAKGKEQGAKSKGPGGEDKGAGAEGKGPGAKGKGPGAKGKG